MDAVILVEIGSPSYKIDKDLNETENTNNYRISLDILEERREQAAALAEAKRQQIAHYFNKKVRPRTFRVGEFVLEKLRLEKAMQA